MKPSSPTGLTSQKVLSGWGSIFLDGLRIVAATTVLVSHSYDRWFPSTQHSAEDGGGTLAHAAVVTFFVLSGFVIAYTTGNKNRGAKQYAIARLSRLCSVVWPALAITAVIQLMLALFDPGLNHAYSRGANSIRYLLAALFLNENWTLSAAPPLNSPLWSLSFEFWYYAIFAAWIFRSKNFRGYALFALFCLIAGPKILLMMPIWMFGCLAFWLPTPKLDKRILWLCIISCMVFAVLAMVYLPSVPWPLAAPPFYFANQFVTDWAVGILIGAAFWLLPLKIKQDHIDSKRWVFLFRKAADLTFPLYVLHYPLLVLFRFLFGFKVGNVFQLWAAILFALVLSSIAGLVLDKQRRKWTQMFQWIFDKGRKIFPGKMVSGNEVKQTVS